MLTALILVCSLAVTPDLADCNHKNALDVLRTAEEFTNPAQCAMRGQAYLAQTAIGRRLTKDEAIKIVCTPTATADQVRAKLLGVD
jgi:hypothetical protein